MFHKKQLFAKFRERFFFKSLISVLRCKDPCEHVSEPPYVAIPIMVEMYMWWNVTVIQAFCKESININL